jgi:hypothetical protein
MQQFDHAQEDRRGGLRAHRPGGRALGRRSMKLGYLPCDSRAADMLYAIVDRRHEKRSTSSNSDATGMPELNGNQDPLWFDATPGPRTDFSTDPAAAIADRRGRQISADSDKRQIRAT